MLSDEFINNCRHQQLVNHGIDPTLFEATRKGDRMRRQWLSAQLAGLHDEVSELAAELNWKPWKVGDDKAEDTLLIASEAADVLIFLGNILSCAGVDAKLLGAAMTLKERRNTERARDIT